MRIRKSTFKGIIIAVIILAVLALSLVAVSVFLKMKNREEPVKSEPVQEATVYGDEYWGIDPVVDEELQDYRNIVIFGLDAEDKESSDGHRSDAIVIVSVNKNTDYVNMFSVYRDTYVDIGCDDDDNDYGLDKINHAYAWGGMPQAVRAVNKNLDLNCREAITITWDVVRTVVDKVGGIDMNITESEYYFMKQSDKFSGDSDFDGPGVQHLNGKQAVYYARMRYDSERGDHRRNERLKDVLIAAMEESKGLDAAARIAIAEDVMKMIDTNMPNSKVTDLAIELAEYDVDSSTEFPYDTRGWYHDGIYYGVPVTLLSNVKELHFKLFDQAEYEPTEFVKKTNQDIVDFTGIQ